MLADILLNEMSQKLFQTFIFPDYQVSEAALTRTMMDPNK